MLGALIITIVMSSSWIDPLIITQCPSLSFVMVFFFNYFFLLYNIVLVLPYINMHPPRVYTCFYFKVYFI